MHKLRRNLKVTDSSQILELEERKLKEIKAMVAESKKQMLELQALILHHKFNLFPKGNIT